MVGKDDSVKLILPFLQRADELQKHDPRVAYYCRLYAMEKGLSIPSKERSKDVNALLLSLMNQLEKDKKVVKANSDDNLYLEGFALNVFAKADKQDRAGKADIATAKTFYAASIFIEVLRQFGELAPDIEEKQKYAVWKAADIRKCLSEGRKPLPGPPNSGEEGEEGEEEIDQFPSVTSSLPSRTSSLPTVPQSFNPTVTAGNLSSSASVPSSFSQFNNMNTNTNPNPLSSLPPYSNVSAVTSALTSPNVYAPPITSAPLGSTPYVPFSATSAPQTSTPYIPFSSSSTPANDPSSLYKSQSVPYGYQPSSSNISQPYSTIPSSSPYSFPQPTIPTQTSSSLPSYSPPSSYPPTKPSPSVSSTLYPQQPLPTIPMAAKSQPVTVKAQPTDNVSRSNQINKDYGSLTYRPTPDKIAEAQKAARLAVSSLAFDDVAAAISYLQQSLKLCTQPNP